MTDVWLGLTILLSGLNWMAVWHGWQAWNYASKALIMVFLLAWLAACTSLSGAARWFGAGLFLSLTGDILLLLSARFFIHGLCAFLITHVCYLAGFLSPPPAISSAVLLVGLISLSLWAVIYALIRTAVKLNPAYRKLRQPLAVYSLAICAMAASAIMTLLRPDWPPQAAGLAASGALLFLFSDVLLAYDRFIQPLPEARLWKRITYHLGQQAIIAAVVLQMAG